MPPRYHLPSPHTCELSRGHLWSPERYRTDICDHLEQYRIDICDYLECYRTDIPGHIEQYRISIIYDNLKHNNTTVCPLLQKHNRWLLSDYNTTEGSSLLIKIQQLTSNSTNSTGCSLMMATTQQAASFLLTCSPLLPICCWASLRSAASSFFSFSSRSINNLQQYCLPLLLLIKNTIHGFMTIDKHNLGPVT